MFGLYGCGRDVDESSRSPGGFTTNDSTDSMQMPAGNLGPIEAGGTISRLPTIGDLLITEVMYDPANGLQDAHAEWIELQVRPVSRSPLMIVSSAILLMSLKNVLRLRAASNYLAMALLVVRSSNAAQNGGLRADSVFTFGLGNGGDTVVFGCADVLLDAVAFDAGVSPRGKRTVDSAFEWTLVPRFNRLPRTLTTTRYAWRAKPLVR